MKQISLWAKQHKNHARVLVVIIKVALACMAYYAGNELYQRGIHLSIIVCWLAAIISICAAILYPSKKSAQLSKHRFYVKQKMGDFILSACTFIIVLTVVNNRDTLNLSLLSASYASFIKKQPPKAEAIIASLNHRQKGSLSRVEKRVLKKELFKQIKIYALAKINHQQEKADTTLPIILTIIAALGLLIVLLSLVCSLSCSGADTAAALVGILGLAAIIFGSVVLIKHITRQSKDKQTPLP